MMIREKLMFDYSDVNVVLVVCGRKEVAFFTVGILTHSVTNVVSTIAPTIKRVSKRKNIFSKINNAVI